jgi:DNA-binding beta-propeller fold protein YncE
MRIISVITIVIILSLFLSFVFLLNYKSLYDDYEYVYAFKPSNAPAADDISKLQQQPSSKDKDSLEVEKEKTAPEKNIIGYQFVNSWGSEGSGDGQFILLGDIGIDSQDNVYVADSENHRIQKFDKNHRIQKFDSEGNFITKWGCEGKGDGQFHYSGIIGIDSQDNVYVADSIIDRIQVFTPTIQHVKDKNN